MKKGTAMIFGIILLSSIMVGWSIPAYYIYDLKEKTDYFSSLIYEDSNVTYSSSGFGGYSLWLKILTWCYSSRPWPYNADDTRVNTSFQVCGRYTQYIYNSTHDLIQINDNIWKPVPVDFLIYDMSYHFELPSEPPFGFKISGTICQVPDPDLQWFVLGSLASTYIDDQYSQISIDLVLNSDIAHDYAEEGFEYEKDGYTYVEILESLAFKSVSKFYTKSNGVWHEEGSYTSLVGYDNSTEDPYLEMTASDP